jgi:transcriptional regulator PpsR
MFCGALAWDNRAAASSVLGAFTGAELFAQSQIQDGSEYVLVDLEPTALAALLEKVADFTLLVEPGGQIGELAVANDELATCVDQSWVGRPWADTAGEAGRRRIEDLLAQALAQPGVPQRGDVVHPLPDGSELPVAYRAISAGPERGVLALGQDMRGTASLRQQLLNAQQALEQDYWRLRQVETRYRRLFEMVDEAIIVVDEATSRVLEANPSANLLLGEEGGSIVGKPFPRGFDRDGSAAVEALLAETRTVGKGSTENVAAAHGEARFTVSASFLRQADEARFLVRVGTEGAAVNGSAANAQQFLPSSLRAAPDAFIQTDGEGRILAANRSFLDLAQLASQEQALGRPADRWLGRSGVDLNVLLANLQEHGSVKLFGSSLHGELGAQAEVEISACRASDAGAAVFAFFIRDIGRRMVDSPRSQQLPRSIEQVTQRVGRVPLKELVRESTDIIEALCIEAALRLTGDNRASAAELLGLSRQSLYAKLRRYNIGGSGSDSTTGR